MKKVLIVEDNLQYAELLSYLLKNNNYHTKTVSSGLEALSALEEDKYDVAIVDQWMPGIDGLETIKRIRNNDHNLGIVMLTAMAPSEAETAVDGLDVWKIIDKLNIEEDKFLETIKDAIELTDMMERI